MWKASQRPSAPRKRYSSNEDQIPRLVPAKHAGARTRRNRRKVKKLRLGHASHAIMFLNKGVGRSAMPTRNINLTPGLDRFVATKVKSGRYENASEVVRAGLR